MPRARRGAARCAAGRPPTSSSTRSGIEIAHLRHEPRPSDRCTDAILVRLDAEHGQRSVTHRRQDDRPRVDEGAVEVEEDDGVAHDGDRRGAARPPPDDRPPVERRVLDPFEDERVCGRGEARLGARSPSSNGSSSIPSSIVPTSVRTMCRRNASAVIVKWSSSPRRSQPAAMIVRRKLFVAGLGRRERREVVAARQTRRRARGAAPRRPAATTRGLAETEALNVSGGAARRSDTTGRGLRSAHGIPLGAGAQSLTERSARENGIECVGDPRGRRTALDHDADDLSRGVDPRVGPASGCEPFPTGEELVEGLAHHSLDRALALAVSPSRESRCRRTRA